MTPGRLDPEVVQRRLREIRVQIDRLDELGDLDAARLRSDWIVAAAVERLLIAAVDLAVEVNTHLVVAAGRVPPQDYRSSFGGAAEAGWLPRELAERLAPSAGLRNVLVHRYLDIDPEQVAAAAVQARSDYRQYVRAVGAALRQRGGEPRDA